MIRQMLELVVGVSANMEAAEEEVARRRSQAFEAIKKRRQTDPEFHVQNETVAEAKADDETRALIRRLAGVD